MVGQGVLLECLDSAEVTAVLAVGRNSCRVEHSKLREIIHHDFFDYSVIEDELTGFDACFFCLGVSAAGMSEEKYHRLTYELTARTADALVKFNPTMTFCYVSGAGTHSSERGRLMWARVKGKTENYVLQLPFKAAFAFRPAFIQPLRGIKSKTRLYQAFYTVLNPLYPLLKTLFPRWVTNTEKVGRAMIRVAREGYPERVIENRDINTLAE
jgi:hypothetical protein